MKNNALLFAIILLLTSLSQVLSDIYLPSLPFIASSFGVSTHLVQLSLFYFMSGLAVSQLFYGSLSDAYGRKYPLIAGLILCVFGSFICLFATNITTFNLGRILQGVGTGAGIRNQSCEIYFLAPSLPKPDLIYPSQISAS